MFSPDVFHTITVMHGMSAPSPPHHYYHHHYTHRNLPKVDVLLRDAHLGAASFAAHEKAPNAEGLASGSGGRGTRPPPRRRTACADSRADTPSGMGGGGAVRCCRSSAAQDRGQVSGVDVEQPHLFVRPADDGGSKQL